MPSANSLESGYGIKIWEGFQPGQLLGVRLTRGVSLLPSRALGQMGILVFGHQNRRLPGLFNL